jgi:hypothetical protein
MGMRLSPQVWTIASEIEFSLQYSCRPSKDKSALVMCEVEIIASQRMGNPRWHPDRRRTVNVVSEGRRHSLRDQGILGEPHRYGGAATSARAARNNAAMSLIGSLYYQEFRAHVCRRHLFRDLCTTLPTAYRTNSPEWSHLASYRSWIAAAGIEDGPVFRAVDRHGRVGRGRMNAGSVAHLIKLADAARLDSASYAGHSLRAGFATQAFLNGAAEVSIMRQTRHKSLHTLTQVHPRPLTVPRQPCGQAGALSRTRERAVAAGYRGSYFCG